MGAQLRVYRRRIRSVQSTKKITKAMELIATSRIAKAQARMREAAPYSQALTRALAELGKDTSLKHPMLTGRDNPQRTGILVITSDRGLAGGYNANVLKRANELAAQVERAGGEVVRYVIGRKGVGYYRFRSMPLGGEWTGFSEQPDFGSVRGATDTVVAALRATSDGETEDGVRGIDALYLVGTRFVNSVSQTPRVLLVSPVKGKALEGAEAAHREDVQDSADSGDETASGGAYEFEPEAEALLASILPRYISARIYSGLLESAASESAARRRAMKSASDNATELIRTYTRLANQARQAEITQEISEIVGGADALAAANEK